MLLSARLCFAIATSSPPPALTRLPAAALQASYTAAESKNFKLTLVEKRAKLHTVRVVLVKHSNRVSPNKIGIGYRFMAMCVTDMPALNNNAAPRPLRSASAVTKATNKQRHCKKINKCKKGIAQPLIIMTKAQITVPV